MSLPTKGAQDLSLPIRHEGASFKDPYGRSLLMRGINVCGSSKLPTKPYPGSTHLYDESLFWDHRNVSFVGRPFPLEEADEHLSRLRAWGLTLIRLLVPWESLEHAGPGLYDEEYIDYLRALISKMTQYGLKCIIDPHQDTWSRFSGGSGAPGWTFEVAGMNIKHFKETGAAYVHNTNAVPGDPLPMVWPTNYTKLASCTMFTLFFGGDVFAPNRTYQGKSVQQFLNDCYLDCYQHLARRCRDLEAILGFEFMNEPHPGYIGLPHLDSFDPITNLIFGDSPTPLQSFALGDRIPQRVGVHIKSWPFPTKKSHERIINPRRLSAWTGECVWREHGVWKPDDLTGDPVLVDSQYFSKHPLTGQQVSFYRDFYKPLVNRYVKAIQAIKPDWYCLVEPLANERAPVYTKEDHHDHVVFSPHWYDLNCVFYKKFDGRMTHDVQSLQRGGNVLNATYFGRQGAKRNYAKQIKNIKQDGLEDMGQKPCILGEVGIPMDLNDRIAFAKDDYSKHVHFLDAIIYALETNLINFTLWNYDVCNDHVYGDHWNGENFSIYSAKKQQQDSQLSKTHLYDGGRVLEAVLRPYACKIAGTPVHSEFDLDQLHYTFSFIPFSPQERQEQTESGYQALEEVAYVTEIFVPYFHFGGKELKMEATEGECRYDEDQQTLYHTYKQAQSTITIHLSLLHPPPTVSHCSIM